MKRGLILINAYSKLKSEIYQSKRMKEELGKLGVVAEIARNDGFLATIETDGRIALKERYDFCVYLDKDKYVSSMLEKCGMRLFNRHDAIQACDDKITTSILLANSGIPMPKTLPGLLCYTPEERVKEATLREIEGQIGYPLIMKTCYGSLGKGVYKIDDREQLAAKAEELKCVPHLFQQFIKGSGGRDIRVIVIGQKYVTAMLRQSNGDFRSNLELGGAASPIDPPEEVKAMCEKIAKIAELDYCGIDILFDEKGYYVCEVNSNAFFGGIERTTGVNIAELYAKYIYKNVYRNR